MCIESRKKEDDYASLLLSNGISMKQNQEWLGHSNYATTANIYAHLDIESKQASADAINSLLTVDSGNAIKNRQTLLRIGMLWCRC